MTGCWYLIDTICDRSPGICEGCPQYHRWQKLREESMKDWKIKLMKKERGENDD